MANKPIKTPDDLQGFKMRTQTSPLMVKSYKVFGANPTPLDFSEVYTGLQLGTIDGQENPNFFIESSKLFEVQKYMIDARKGLPNSRLVDATLLVNSVRVIKSDQEAHMHFFMIPIGS
ncbi:TRAP transporter substrate-binding protein DctP [Brevibacillus humidisoli]|uniref:TRAP transporter substrate-binding protein DctP n=1 Tax=Brevibacillus humidisoli TaxID=2895522 RepID=UPI001E45BDF6|nr:TRAP transporter substrate-binding protein DctP [Brevibacillus humidisoli]